LGALKFVRARLLGWTSVANRRSCSPRAQPGPRATSANAPQLSTLVQAKPAAAADPRASLKSRTHLEAPARASRSRPRSLPPIQLSAPRAPTTADGRGPHLPPSRITHTSRRPNHSHRLAGPVLQWARCSGGPAAPSSGSLARPAIRGHFYPPLRAVRWLVSGDPFVPLFSSSSRFGSRAFVVFLLLVAITPRSNPHTHTKKKKNQFLTAGLRFTTTPSFTSPAALRFLSPGREALAGGEQSAPRGITETPGVAEAARSSSCRWRGSSL
jgi:hypothetical protein